MTFTRDTRVSYTCVGTTSLGDLPHDERVRDENDDERRKIQCCDVEQIVSEFVRVAWERVEGHALLEPIKLRVRFHVKDDALKSNEEH